MIRVQEAKVVVVAQMVAVPSVVAVVLAFVVAPVVVEALMSATSWSVMVRIIMKVGKLGKSSNGVIRFR